jgi:hypothetical protein
MDVNACCDEWNHSSTSSKVDLWTDNNVTWIDAFQFGKEGDTTWSFHDKAFELDIQLSPYDTVPLMSLTTANGRIVVDSETMRVLHFDVPAADIQAALRPGEYVYDLVMVDGSTRIQLMHGTLEVVQGVTYPP